MPAHLEPVPLADDGDRVYSPPNPAWMPEDARRFHEGHQNYEDPPIVTLADGCTLAVDAASYLPLRPNARDAAGGRQVCRCEDDAQGVVAAYLLAWPDFAATHLPRAAGWTRPLAAAFAARLLEDWDLVARRLRPPGLPPAVKAAVAEALEGGPAGIALREQQWEARRKKDEKEIEHLLRVEEARASLAADRARKRRG